MNITAIHALVGGLAAQLGGGSFTTGATGATSAEISRNLVKDLSPDAQQWASVIIGGAAAKVVGSNAQVGASTALSGTVNNDLAHKITGITKGILNGVEEDAKGLIDFVTNYQKTIENLKDTANAIYDLGKEQGFGAVFAEIGNAISGDWVNKYDTIENEYINGMIDENTYDYRIGMLAGEVTYFIASTVAEPEKLAVNPKLLTKVAKLSKVEKLSEFTLDPVIVTAKRIEGSGKADRVYVPNPKHDAPGGKISPNPFGNDTVAGQKSLEAAYSSSGTKQLYNVYDGKLVKFQPDNAGGYHPYEVINPSKEVPTDVLRQMKKDGIISNVQYNKWIKNQ